MHAAGLNGKWTSFLDWWKKGSKNNYPSVTAYQIERWTHKNKEKISRAQYLVDLKRV